VTYLWQNLSDYDFEALSRDLLQQALKIQLESFTKGRDQGIDLRALSSPSRARQGPIIVQCKHFAGSRFSALRSSLKKEITKISELKAPPRRYIVTTTLGLTPANKATLVSDLAPYLRTEADIFGQSDIENLLGQYPDVETRHFKLWLANGDRLAALNNASIVNRSDITRESLLAKSKLFVPHKRLEDARKLLRENHVCVISGPAGVGKTTLAQMLIIEYLTEQFTFYDVSSDIEEAERALTHSGRQIFLYDDFLGRTNFVASMPKNEDKRLVELLRHISTADNKRIVLTTREYILRASQRRYDRLDDPAIETAKLVIEMDSYSRLQRAQILYNHLYFNQSVSGEELRDLCADRRYLRIVDHPHFNPRMIEAALQLRARRT
jgi:Restriction endonuclease